MVYPSAQVAAKSDMERCYRIGQIKVLNYARWASRLGLNFHAI